MGEHRRVAGTLDDDVAGTRDLRRHVHPAGEELAVPVADDDQRGHVDVGQVLDHQRVALAEDAPRGVHEPVDASVVARPHLVADARHPVDALGLERRRERLAHVVPSGAGVVAPVAGSGADEHERGHALRV
jgi:hypothetical protein